MTRFFFSCIIFSFYMNEVLTINSESKIRLKILLKVKNKILSKFDNRILERKTLEIQTWNQKFDEKYF